MSRSNPQVTTPAQKFFKWRGSTGDLVWYDRDSEKEIEVKRPFRFIVLDRLSTIKGYNKDTESGIWSNEVKNIKTDTLTVKMKGSTFAVGQYDTIKNELKAQGGKFAQSVYIAFQESRGDSFEWIIGNINFAGASLGAWFDFSRTVRVEKPGTGIVLQKEINEEKNGATKFFVPTFGTFDTEPASEEIFADLDRELQDYLNVYLAQSNGDEPPSRGDYDGIDNEPQDDYSQDVEKVKAVGNARRDVVLEDIDDKPIDLSEIPF